MRGPSGEEVEQKVFNEVGTYARLKPSTVKSNRTKALDKLGIDHVGFVHLVAALRAYIHFFHPLNPRATLKVGEVEKAKFTVDDLIALVKKRIGI